MNNDQVEHRWNQAVAYTAKKIYYKHGRPSRALFDPSTACHALPQEVGEVETPEELHQRHLQNMARLGLEVPEYHNDFERSKLYWLRVRKNVVKAVSTQRRLGMIKIPTNTPKPATASVQSGNAPTTGHDSPAIASAGSPTVAAKDQKSSTAASPVEPEKMISDDQEAQANVVDNSAASASLTDRREDHAIVGNNLVNQALNHKVPATVSSNNVERMDVDDHEASAGSPTVAAKDQKSSNAVSPDEPERMESDDQEVPGIISSQANVINNLVNKALNHKVPATVHPNEVERMDVDDHDAPAESQSAIVTTPVIPVTEAAAVVQNHEVQANAAQKPIETEIHEAPRVEAKQNEVPAVISADNMIKSDVPTANAPIDVSAGSQPTAVTNSAIPASSQAPAGHCSEVQADEAQNMEVDLPATEANHHGLPTDIPSLTVVNRDATLATGSSIGVEKMKTGGRTSGAHHHGFPVVVIALQDWEIPIGTQVTVIDDETARRRAARRLARRRARRITLDDVEAKAQVSMDHDYNQPLYVIDDHDYVVGYGRYGYKSEAYRPLFSRSQE